MELVIIAIALCLLGLLAGRVGYDSRDGLRSHEERLSAQGFAWGGEADPHAAAALPIRSVLLSRMPHWGWRHLQA